MKKSRNWVRRALAVGAVVASVLVAPTSASAAGGEHGELLLHGVGSLYAGPNVFAGIVTTPGGTALIPFEVHNTGTAPAQFNLRFFPSHSCIQPDCPGVDASYAVAAGSANIVAIAAAPNGYFTAPINPGAAAKYTLKVTTPKTAPPDSCYQGNLSLYDTAGTFLNGSFGDAITKATTGTTDHDQFVNGPGQSAIRVPNSTTCGLYVNGPAATIGQTQTFTVKLKNDGAVPESIAYSLSAASPACTSFFDVTVKAGATDVTALALAGTYHTPTLAPGVATTLSVAIKYLASARSCLGRSSTSWASVATGASNVPSYVQLFFLIAAGN